MKDNNSSRERTVSIGKMSCNRTNATMMAVAAVVVVVMKMTIVTTKHR
jgi:hypothetical protein